METQPLQQPHEARFATPLAMASFAIGTVLFALYQCHIGSLDLLVFGFLFVLTAALANSVMLLNLLFLLFIYPNQRETIAVKILLLLSNIPVACVYFSFVADTAGFIAPLHF